MSSKTDSAFEINNRILDEVAKYEATLATLASAAIAFAINASISLKIDWSMIPLFLSVLLWGLTVIFGFRAWFNRMEIMGQMADVIVVSNKLDKLAAKEARTDAERLGNSKILDGLKKELEANNALYKVSHKKYDTAIMRLQAFFVAGIALFAIWWILRMIINAAPLTCS